MARPREFDYDEVLGRAMDVFWQKGYLGTSIQDLVDATGINRGSLYSTFRDKHALFLEALGRYSAAVVPTRIGILTRDGAGMSEIREYFDAVCDDLAGAARDRGCLMVNSAIELAAGDSQVAERVSGHLDRLERAFGTALAGAAERGEISDASRVPELARFLVGAAQGLIVVGKANPDSRLLRDIVAPTLRALG